MATAIFKPITRFVTIELKAEDEDREYRFIGSFTGPVARAIDLMKDEARRRHRSLRYSRFTVVDIL